MKGDIIQIIVTPDVRGPPVQGGQGSVQGSLVGQDGAGALALKDLGGRRALPRGEAPLLDETAEAQALEEVVQRGGRRELPEVFLRGELDGRVPADGGEGEGFTGAALPFRELFALTGLDGGVVKVFVHPVQGAEAAQQVQGGFLPDAGDAGNVVRRVAHEGLEVDHFDGVEAVLLPEDRGVVLNGLGLTHARLDVDDVAFFRDELEGVLVPGDEAAVIPRLLADAGHGAQKVVRLPARQLVPADAHGVEDLLQNGHLDLQLLGHALAGGLIGGAQLVAEGWGVDVEGHADAVGLLLVHEPLQDREKAIDAVRGRTVRRVQHTDAVKRPVHDGVPVDDHEFFALAHGVTSFAGEFVIKLFYHISRKKETGKTTEDAYTKQQKTPPLKKLPDCSSIPTRTVL